MLPILKKVLSYFLLSDQIEKKEQSLIVETKNTTLVEQLEKIVGNKILENIFTNPTFKLYKINVYAPTFKDLLDLAVIKDLNRTDLVSINLYGYFRDCYDINEILSRLIIFMKSNKIPPKVEYDIIELLSAIEFLSEKEK